MTVTSAVYERVATHATALPERVATRIFTWGEAHDPTISAKIVARSDCPEEILTAARNSRHRHTRTAWYARTDRDPTEVAATIERERTPTAVLTATFTDPAVTGAASALAQRTGSMRLAATLAQHPIRPDDWKVIRDLVHEHLTRRHTTARCRIATVLRDVADPTTHTPPLTPDLQWVRAATSTPQPGPPGPDLLRNDLTATSTLEQATREPVGAAGSLARWRTTPPSARTRAATEAHPSTLHLRARAATTAAELTALLDEAARTRAGPWAILDQAEQLPDDERDTVLRHASRTHPAIAASTRHLHAVPTTTPTEPETSSLQHDLARNPHLTGSDLWHRVRAQITLEHLHRHADTVASQLNAAGWDDDTWELFEDLLERDTTSTFAELVDLVDALTGHP